MTADWFEALKQEAERLAVQMPAKLQESFTKCYLNTAETTVQTLPDGSTFIITGDIPAMWLRDSAAQVHHYLPMAARSNAVYKFVSSVLAKQFFYIAMDPYGNAFNAGPTGAHYAPDRSGQTEWQWERKYEVDSLCFPVDLAWQLWKATGRTEHLTDAVHRGAAGIVKIWLLEQHHEEQSGYRFERDTTRPTETLARGGLGTPVAYTGMTWSAFRCSDDACTYGYNIPANMYAAVVLDYMAEIADMVWHDEALSAEAAALGKEIRDGIEKYGTVDDSEFGRMYVYEADGLGHQLLMDDAGVPGLLSAPYYGYCDKTDPVYRSTRRFSLSPRNPFFYTGKALSGLGSPHSKPDFVWPMGIIMQGFTVQPEENLCAILDMVAHAGDGTDYVHESVHKDDPSRYTRPWFAWVNSLYSELLIKTFVK